MLEWEPDDRDKLLAFMLERAERCSMCGTSNWEWEEDPYAYEATVAHCRGCAHKDAARDDSTTPGSFVILVPAEEAARLRAAPAKKAPRRRPRG